MSICYLLFCELLENPNEGQNYYARRRSLNGQGLTINSQRRYTQYFKQFLGENFKKPYISCLKDYRENPSEFVKSKMVVLQKKMILKFMILGPFKSKKNMECLVKSKI
jgi:hypothetical protein